MSNRTDITWQDSAVTRELRSRRNGHKSCILWLTGLSGSGKSTLSFALEERLYARSIQAYVLDGDNVRHGLNRDLGFSSEDRTENIRRIGEVSKLFVDAGMLVLSAFISPNENDRLMVRNLFPPEDFIEVYVKCSLEECERRDPKGMYKKVREGKIRNFTGISAPYDIPRNPEIVVDTEQWSLDESLSIVLEYLEAKGYLTADR